jgi:hypothetical protein
LVVSSGAALDLNGQSMVNTLSVAGTGVGQSGVVYNSHSTTVGVATGAVTLTADSTFKSDQGMGLQFGSSVSGGYALGVTGANNTFTHTSPFVNTGMLSLGAASSDSFSFPNGATVTAPSSINLAGTLQTSNALLNLGDASTPLVLTAATTLNSGTGMTTLGGVLSGSYSLTVSGPATLNGATVNTGTAAQTYGSSVVLGVDTLLTASTVTLGGALTGNSSLVVDAVAALNGGSVNTGNASQRYKAAVTLGADTTLNAGTGEVTFESTIDTDTAVAAASLTKASVTSVG